MLDVRAVSLFFSFDQLITKQTFDLLNGEKNRAAFATRPLVQFFLHNLLNDAVNDVDLF